MVLPDDDEGIKKGKIKVAEYAALMGKIGTEDDNDDMAHPDENARHAALPFLLTVAGSGRAIAKVLLIKSYYCQYFIVAV